MHEQGPGAAMRLTDLTKVYPNTDSPALDGFTLDINGGEFITLLGPSGSGKSTLLGLCAGFQTATAGRIELDGTDIGPLPPHKRSLGMVFQNYALFPHMTVAENVTYPLRRRKVGKAEAATLVKDALQRVQLTKFADRLPSQLSGGQQQRVALARAFIFKPRVLLLDEPLAALDRRLRGDMQVELKALHRELGMTFILVTHDQEEALSMSDRVALLNDGRLEQVGTPTELYASPRTVFAAEFLGESNLFQGHYDVGSGHLVNEQYTLSVTTMAGAAADSPHALVVRPESMTVLAAEAPVPSGCNALGARVEDVIHLGGTRRLILRFPWGGTGSAQESAGVESRVRRGDDVQVTWRVESGHLVDSGPTTVMGPVASDA